MEIPELDTDKLIVDSCRRLTGPSLVWNEAGAILDVLIRDLDMQQVLECWQRQLGQLLADIDWPQPRHTHRQFEGGYNLLLAAPIDQLYSAVLVLETAWYCCACELLAQNPDSRAALLDEIRAQMGNEGNPALLEIEKAAAARGVDFLVDDESVSLGHGIGSHSYSIDQIPSPDAVDWSAIHDIPVAMITGTNGKSTSVRLLDAIARGTGQVAGVTSTDFVRVGDDILDHGDYSGPGGARLLLRDNRLEVAFLEVARGGILRRGLPLRRARAALVTNIASDHLGQYGVNTLADLTQTKLAVTRTLAADGVLVTNADDEEIVRFVEAGMDCRICWFSLDKSSPRIQRNLARGEPCIFADGDNLVYYDGAGLTVICRIDAIPMTLGGAALHNVQNALGAIGVAAAMGYTPLQIGEGLSAFHSDDSDNPGRLNQFTLSGGTRVFVDFAHNEHSVKAIAATLSRIPAARKWVMFGSAGDRSDEHMQAIARAVCSMQPDHIVISEIEHYLRGRKPGEVSGIMQQACIECGRDRNSIHLVESPLAGVDYALQHMGAEDLGLFLVLSEREEIIERLKSA